MTGDENVSFASKLKVRCIGEISGHSRTMSALASYRPTGKYLATGSDDFTVRIWNVAPTHVHNSPIRELNLHPERVRKIAFLPNAEEYGLVAFGNVSGAVQLWDVHTENDVALYRIAVGYCTT